MANEKPIYIKNARGGVHSVTEEHYKALLEEDGTLPKNWAKLSEADARKTAPALFGLDENGNPVKTPETAGVKPADAPDWARQLMEAIAGQKASGGE